MVGINYLREIFLQKVFFSKQIIFFYYKCKWYCVIYFLIIIFMSA